MTDAGAGYPADGVHLADGWWAAWVVDGTGVAWPWLIQTAVPDGRERCGCACPRCAPHEQHGTLPPEYRLSRW